MQAHEIVLSHINIVRTLAQIKVQNADGIYLLHLFIGISQIDMLCDGFGYSIEHTLQVIQFTCVLYLDDNDFSLAVFRLDVNPVELIISLLLITFTFQNINNLDRFIQKHSQEALKHPKVRLLAKQTLDSPVKTYVSIS